MDMAVGSYIKYTYKKGSFKYFARGGGTRNIRFSCTHQA